MRLDKYLKVSRLIKRRTLANDVVDAGRVGTGTRRFPRSAYAVQALAHTPFRFCSSGQL